jgi:hypothetical protein
LGVRLAFSGEGDKPTQRGRGENVSAERALEFFVKRMAFFNVLACTLLAPPGLASARSGKWNRFLRSAGRVKPTVNEA